MVGLSYCRLQGIARVPHAADFSLYSGPANMPFASPLTLCPYIHQGRIFAVFIQRINPKRLPTS